MIRFPKKIIPDFYYDPSRIMNIEPEFYHYCTKCNADLMMQNGFNPGVPYWKCLGCGQMLIRPDIESKSDIVWICDRCGAFLNSQKGFNEKYDKWTCAECGNVNAIDEKEVYLSEDEYEAMMRDPYKGLSDRDRLELSCYEEVRSVDDRDDVFLVRHRETGTYYIRKLIENYNKSVYEYLINNPVEHMPVLIDIFEGDNALVVIEEYIEGKTVVELIKDGSLLPKKAVMIAKEVCRVLDILHNLPTPIVHRDVKPSNVIVTSSEEVYLLDMNIAKWYAPDESDDTYHMGTMNYASPEQVGFGFFASSAKSDIYSVGVMINEMITGKYPKEEKATGPIWNVIERCIRLNADERYTASELISALESFGDHDD